MYIYDVELLAGRCCGGDGDGDGDGDVVMWFVVLVLSKVLKSCQTQKFLASNEKKRDFFATQKQIYKCTCCMCSTRTRIYTRVRIGRSCMYV